jgi:transposase
MSDDRRRFALRENGEETSVFTGKQPRQAALKAARRLDPKSSKGEAIASSERIRLREYGTIKIHVYESQTWEESTTEDDPEWLGDRVTRANVEKVGVETVTKDEEEFEYDRLSPLLSDQPIRITREECPTCGSSLEDSFKIAVGVKDVPDPPIVQHSRYYYECDNCEEEVVAEKEGLPSKGRYGANLVAQAVLFRYEYRVPYRKIASLFDQLYGCSISKAGVLHLCERLCEVARTEYKEIAQQLKREEVLYVDETPHSVGDSKHWLWAFTTGEETLFAFRETRGTVVLEEVLGEEFSGIIACDGHRAYPAFHQRLQRCWTHLLRGTDDLDEDDTEALEIYSKLRELFQGLKRFLNTSPTVLQRVVVERAAREKLEELVATKVESEDAADVLTMLENGLGHWLTFVLYPKVEPTNYKVESLLREPIVLRRIIGTLRNEKGMRLHETFLSLLRTWKQQEKNPYSELQRLAQQV